MAVNSTAIWRVRPSGNNTNGGGFDSAISGAGTDYSQQNSAQANGTNGVTVGTTSFVDATANAFTSQMVGNAIYISGSGQTTGFYFVTAFTSASTVTLDRSPGTGTGATWNLGGGWADFVTNTVDSAGLTPIVPGNTVYVLGSGTPNPTSYTYDYTVTSAFTFVNGSGQGGGSSSAVLLANDPSTPGYKAPPDTTGGMPVVKVNTGAANFMNIGSCTVAGLWFVANTMNAGKVVLPNTTSPCSVFGCVFDQLGSDTTLVSTSTGLAFPSFVSGCEAFSSSGGSGGSNYAIIIAALGGVALNCNVHDCVGKGILINFGGSALGCIIAKCSSDGVSFGNNGGLVINCTIDANGGNGISGGPRSIVVAGFLNNIISNHAAGGTFGISLGQGSPRNALLMDYNVFYNNATDISNSWPYSPHDTHGGSNPYVGQSTENYTLA